MIRVFKMAEYDIKKEDEAQDGQPNEATHHVLPLVIVLPEQPLPVGLLPHLLGSLLPRSWQIIFIPNSILHQMP